MSNFETSNYASSSTITVAQHSMPIREMYNVMNKQDGAFGINGYKVPADYHDPRKLKEQRENTQQKKAPKATKVNDYLSESVKAAGQVPGPIYNVVKPWVDETKKSGPPKNVGKKTTFLEAIEDEAKRRPVPGPGAYDVLKQDAKKAAGSKGKGSERLNFLCDSEYLSEASPGPGNYNPRTPQPKVKESKMKPEDWRKKHKDENSKKSSLPDIGTYSPCAVDFNTFDKILEKSKSNKNGNGKVWGTEVRLKKEKPVAGPGPGDYKVVASWGPDKTGGKKDDKKHVNLFNVVSKGITKSIYYS